MIDSTNDPSHAALSDGEELGHEARAGSGDQCIEMRPAGLEAFEPAAAEPGLEPADQGTDPAAPVLQPAQHPHLRQPTQAPEPRRSR